MRVESRVTSVSWVPSDSASGIARLPFVIGLERHDDPPPDQLDDPQGLVAANLARQVNDLRAWVEFDDSGTPVEWGYATPADEPSGDAFPVLRADPEVGEHSVRFVQTAGGPLGGSVPRRVVGRPFFRVDAPVAWTTLALAIAADGSSSGELAGSSAFPRHWVYDETGHLQAKSGETDYRRWLEGAHGERTPWGGEDSREYVIAAESALERRLSRQIMSSRPPVRRFEAGAMLTEQGARDDAILLVLDGVLDVDIGGQTVAEIGPGAIIGERASLEGRRSATVRARTDVRVVLFDPSSLSPDELEQLAGGHRREDD
jgi:hypothetical protein